MTTTATTAKKETTAASPADRLAPSVPATLFICLSLFAVLAGQHRLLNGDGDLPRHIRHGLYMLQHHGLIWRDPFSFTRFGDPFVPFEYGSQILYALVYRAAGLPGITVLAGCLIGATYALMARMLLRRGVDPLLVFLATAAGAILGFPHWMARPHLFSWVAIVLCLSLVEPARRRYLWAVPLLFLLWANIHGGWLYGVALLCIYMVGHVLEYLCFGRRREELLAAKYFALALPLALLATLMTPMGL